MLKGDFSEDGKHWISEEGEKYEVIEAKTLMAKVKDGVYPDEIDLKKKYIKGSINFENVEFKKRVNLKHCIFSDKVHFIFAQFNDITNFTSNRFINQIDFKYSKFTYEASFDKTQFLGYTDFSATHFIGNVYFRFVQFFDHSYFRHAHFSNEADFLSSKFFNLAAFSSSQFSGEASFTSAQFFSMSSFESVLFTGNSDFNNVKFSGNASFDSTQFSGETKFNNTFFYESVNFISASFNSKSYFEKTYFFCDTIDFRECAFSQVTFEKSVFFANNYVDFSRSRFSDICYFQEVLFLKEVNFLQIHVDLILVFNQTNMTNVSFRYSDLKKIKFENVKWMIKKAGNIDRFALIDENLYRSIEYILISADLIAVDENDKELHGCYIEESKKSLIDEIKEEQRKNWVELQRQYSQLRQYYEENKDFTTSEHFYFSEMEAKRKRETLSTRIFMWFYKLFFGYSLSILRPVLTLLALIFILFPLIYAATGLESDKLIFSLSGDRFSWDLLEYSLKVSVFRKVDKFVGVPVLTTFVNTVQFILTVLLTGFTAFAVRKRFKR